MNTSTVRAARCVACGRFMNCDEIDARCEFTPDSHFEPERIEWICGPCARAEREDGT